MISVIVPAKDAAGTLGECLQALLAQDGLQIGQDYEVIVVDDGSSDQTAEIATAYPVSLVRQANAGPAAARNAGARQATGDIFAFTDADCAPSPTWLKTLTGPFSDQDVVGTKGVYCTHQTARVARFVQLEYEFKYARMQKQATIDFIDTYSAAYRARTFLSNGGFDQSFRFSSVEDQEFSFRLARKGYRMLFVPQAVVYHYHDRTLSDYLRRKHGIGYWKASMLRWVPEKTFTDSHTAPTQRLEILLLASLLAAIPFVIIWPLPATIAFLALLAAFLLIGSPFLSFILKRDPPLFWIAAAMLVARAGALGSGLLKGIVSPPAMGVSVYPCQMMGVRLVKRLMDIVGGAMGLVLASPLIACAALAIRLDSRGPAFYRQARAGENGKPFTLIKLRTMVDGADKMVLELLHKSSIKGPAFKIPGDPRITRVGRHLRRWSLDELPQLWNVLKGEMSLVGPRPEELAMVRQYDDHQRQRLMVKPGLTGPMQVHGRGGLDFDARLQLELAYLKNYSLWEDFKILYKTFAAVISGEGAS